MEAHREPTTNELLIQIRNLTEKVSVLTEKVEELTTSLIDIKLKSAHKTGYEAGAVFWFKAGYSAALTAVVGGCLILFSFFTGKANISDIFK